MTGVPAPAARAVGDLPAPAAHPVWGHLGRWGTEPLDLLAEGARLGPLFALRLPRRPAVVGYSPAWNRFLLRDGEVFRARRSLTRLVPHLAAGIVMTDVPAHRPRRALLDTPFRDVEGLRARVRAAAGTHVPGGRFEALAWSSEAVRLMLNAALFGGTFPPRLLRRYLHPLERAMPSALVPRPSARRRVRAELARQVARRRQRPTGDVASALAHVPGAVEELRVALAAGFDTSAHVLAWALWYLAANPGWQAPGRRERALDEVLRLHPPGFVGSRRSVRPATFEGVRIPAGTLVLYSPLLTHRSPELWPDPERFDPARFDGGVRGWTYLPFSAGQRTCLGARLARLMLTEALDAVLARPLRAAGGRPEPLARVTMGPGGPLYVAR